MCHAAFTVGFTSLQSLTIQAGALASLQAMAIRAPTSPPLRIESPVLTAFTTMPNALGEAASLSISQAKALRTVHIGDNCFNKAKAFTLSGAEALEAFEVGDHCFQQVKEFDLSCGLFSVFSSSAATLLETFRAGNASFPTTTKLSLIGRSFPA